MRLWPTAPSARARHVAARAAALATRVLGGGTDAPAAGALAARLLDPGRLARYDGLALRVRRGMGERHGDRRVPGRPQPSGIEIEAHGAYAPGDDLRHLDWNALGRLDALLVRRFTAEREIVVHVLLDASASLAVPVVDDKLGSACELAMALAYVALSTGDALRVAILRGDGSAEDGAAEVGGTTSVRRPVASDGPASRIFRQRASVARVAELLAAVAPQGSFGLGAALAAYAARYRTPGLALVISDFLMEPDEIERGVLALRSRGFETHLLHVIGAGELDPTRVFTRGVLVDVESGAQRPIALTAPALARYHAALGAHCDALAALAARVEAGYGRLVAGGDVAELLTGPLVRAGLVRRR